MKKYNIKTLCFSISLIFAFLILTLLVGIIDVKPIGPNGSTVGFSTINALFHSLTGVNLVLYIITDWLGLVPVFVGMGFTFLGLFEWIKRRNILRVDFDILVLGGFYIVTLISYLFFENLVINYRPILINGYLEASYPSSTTLLVLCVMPTAIMQFNHRIKNKTLKALICTTVKIFIIFMVLGRLISGVHWLTDIVGGVLLSAGLVTMYNFVCSFKERQL